MMEYGFDMELLDIVDENGKPTGETVERKTAHSEGIRHRTAHVWIVRKSDEGAEVLLQKRAMNKTHFLEDMILLRRDIFRPVTNRRNLL